VKKRLCLRLLDASMGHRANVYLNGQRIDRVVACGPLWARAFLKDEKGEFVIRGGELVTRLRFGLVQYEPLEDVEGEWA
jgi:hypothetical protein